MDKGKAIELMTQPESDWLEKTISFSEDKLSQAVCAFSNDFPNRKKPGYIIIGVDDNGRPSGLKLTDKEVSAFGNIKTNGRVLPPPSLVVSDVYSFPEGDVVLIEVKPSDFPPVRYDGRCWIRVGPRRDKATIAEEKLLTERRSAHAKTYDLLPVPSATLQDLSAEEFLLRYLPLAIDKDTLEQNGRDLKEQMASLRFFDMNLDCPTNAGILLFGKSPIHFLPGAYVQYVRFEGAEMTTRVLFEKRFAEPLVTGLKALDDFISSSVVKERPVRKDGFREEKSGNYPYWALRELLMNAIMHRSYESNAPIYLYEFSDRMEIVNPGGLFGDVTKANFPNASDYRNVVLAEAMKVLGYVNRFNYGVKRAIEELVENGNGHPVFDLELGTKFKVTIPAHPDWVSESKN